MYRAERPRHTSHYIAANLDKGSSPNQCDRFGWIGWIYPVDFLGHPVDLFSLSVTLRIRTAPIQWISFPIQWIILKIITLDTLAHQGNNLAERR